MANLTLPEIFVQLPEDVQVALITALEGCNIPTNVGSDQLFTATELITENLKNGEFSSAPAQVRNLLDQVPQAVVDALI